MMDAVLAFSTGFIWAVGIILSRKSLSNSNFFSSIMVITLVGNIIIWPMLLFLNPKTTFNVYGFILFVLAGLFQPGLARLLYFKGMLKAGVAPNASIFATYPLFSTLLAIFLLNEQPTFFLWIGIVLVVAGAIIIQNSMHNKDAIKSAKSGLLISAGASIVAGLGFVFKKVGLNAYNEPLVGVGVSYLTSMILYTFMFAISPRIRSQTSVDSKALKLFWKTGLCLVMGHMFAFYAMQFGNVSVVAPLLQTEPLFVLLLTQLYLKDYEQLSRRLAFGTLLIVLGIAIITVFRSL